MTLHIELQIIHTIFLLIKLSHSKLFRLIMNANLSIIKEDARAVTVKEIGNASNDSGINSNTSSNASNDDSSNVIAGTKSEVENIIIPFQALNTGGRKESTFVATSSSKTACNISGIEGSDGHKNTIDSEGKWKSS